MFLRKANVQDLTLHGEENNIVASLFFANFPTDCLVEQTKEATVQYCSNINFNNILHDVAYNNSNLFLNFRYPLGTNFYKSYVRGYLA